MTKQYNLEDRLVAYAGEVLLFAEKLPKTYSCEYFSKQLIRSSGSTALNFGETQGAVSDKDYIHKISLSIKDLKESRLALKVLKYIKVYDLKVLDNILGETEQIIAILSRILINKQNRLIGNNQN